MLSKTNNNYYKPNHLVDDWGFYIDLESIQPIPNNEEKIRTPITAITAAAKFGLPSVVMIGL